MRLAPWLRSLRYLSAPSDTTSVRGCTRLRKRATAANLNVTRLEDRTVLSTFTVQNLADSGLGSLRAAIANANTHAGADVIVFAHGARDGTIGLTSGELAVTDDLQIDGPGASRLAVSGGDATRVFDISSGVLASIDGLAITHGLAVGQGGGILNAGNLTLTHVVLSDNQVVGIPGANVVMDAFGGGISNSGNLAVSQSSFVHDRAIGGDGTSGTTGTSALGGATRSAGTASAPATASISYCTFVDNQAIAGAAGAGASRAGIGGALMNDAGTMTVSCSLFDGNQAVGGLVGAAPGGFGAGSGGAIGNVARLGNAIVTVSHCQLTNNQAVGGSSSPDLIAQNGRGGAIANFMFGGIAPPVTITATVHIDHSTLIGNQAKGGAGTTGGSGQGGGIANLIGGVLTVADSVIGLNQATGGTATNGSGGNAQGGGIFNGGPSPVGTPSLTLTRTLVTLNRAAGGAATSGGSAGLGQGGGLYLTTGGVASADRLSIILANDASTSDKNVFGVLGKV